MSWFRSTLCVLLVFTISKLNAQDATESGPMVHKNSIQAEAFGGAYIYSLNYERMLITGQKFVTAGQAGLAFWGSNGELVTAIRVDATELIGQKTVKFELGFGVVFFNERSSNNTSTWNNLLAYRLGIRIQNPSKRMLYRVSFTPLYGGFGDTVGIIPWGGLSLGYSF